MCTAITYQTKHFYLGRTLDYHMSYGEEVVITPRAFPLRFSRMGTMERHYAVIGMAHVEAGFPLYYDAVNEKGLAMAGLNFVGNAVYGKPCEGKDSVASFELIPWILSQCASVKEAAALLERIRITDESVWPDQPPAQLHWIIGGHGTCITVESMADGLHVCENPAGVLANNPPFSYQMLHLNQFMQLSPEMPQNRLSSHLPLAPYSLGMGAFGLPGDLSSPSRFVRAVFARENSVSGDSETESVSQFFHLLDTVAQARGLTETADGGLAYTLYSSCCSADQGIYYYTTYENRRITALSLHHTDLDADELIRYPLRAREEIAEGN